MDENTPYEDISNMPENGNPLFEDISDEMEELQAYRDALAQEWEDKTTGATARELARDTKQKIVELVPDALNSLRVLAVTGKSESVRYQASKWILENALLPNKAGSTDALTELLEEMEAQENNESPQD